MMSQEVTNSKKTLTLRGITLGEGKPKICVPLTAANDEELSAQLEGLQGVPFDLVEWRVDYEPDFADEQARGRRAAMIREAVGANVPILFTFRSKAEGGERAITFAGYEAMLLDVAQRQLADLVDVELFCAESVRELVRTLHTLDMPVIGSSHDFQKTPSLEEMTGRLCRMQDVDMDITKLAVMPQCEADVLRLLEAAVEMKTRLGDRPCVTMSMGALGQVTRLCGSLSGSAITFATAGRASAPGQLSARTVADVL